jgi:hypothetical protein
MSARVYVDDDMDWSPDAVFAERRRVKSDGAARMA